MAITPGAGYTLNAAGNGVVPTGSTAQAQGLGVYNTGGSNTVSNPNANYFTNNITTPTLSNGAPATLSSSPVTQPNPAAPVTGTPALTGDALNTYLNNQFDNSSESSSILDAYNSQVAATNANLGASNTATQNYYQGQSAEQQIQGGANFQTGITNSKGLVNPGAMQIIQDQSEALLSTINNQLNDAIANNDTAAQQSLSQAAATEVTNLVTARQNFLDNYFSAQNESRSESAFPLTQAQTQSQTTQNLASAAASQASASESTAAAAYTAAQSKQLTQLTPSEIEENLAAAGASSAGANASNATAAQTQAMTSFLKTGAVGASDPNVVALKNGTATPDEIYTKYPTSVYGGYAASIISQAQLQGYNLNSGTLSAQSQSNTTNALSSGNPFNIIGSLGAQGVGTVGALLTGSNTTASTPSLSSVTMKGPGGTFSVPSSQIPLFTQNGYTTVQ